MFFRGAFLHLCILCGFRFGQDVGLIRSRHNVLQLLTANVSFVTAVSSVFCTKSAIPASNGVCAINLSRHYTDLTISTCSVSRAACMVSADTTPCFPTLVSISRSLAICPNHQESTCRGPGGGLEGDATGKANSPSRSNTSLESEFYISRQYPLSTPVIQRLSNHAFRIQSRHQQSST